jgi:hypothetical protein
MEVSQYYVTTLTNAFMKIGPLIAFLVIGYFIFVKLPFLFFLNNMKKTKEKLKEEELKRPPIPVVKPIEASSKKKEAPKKEPPRARSEASAENLFEIETGKALTKEELKKKYHELLKMNHPDKVAALSPEFRALADKRTKEINEAYRKLLKRAG